MKLAPHEAQSVLWQKLVAYYEPRLVKLRSRLENPHISKRERLELCWRIKGMKELIALGEPVQEQESPAD